MFTAEQNHALLKTKPHFPCLSTRVGPINCLSSANIVTQGCLQVVHGLVVWDNQLLKIQNSKPTIRTPQAPRDLRRIQHKYRKPRCFSWGVRGVAKRPVSISIIVRPLCPPPLQKYNQTPAPSLHNIPSTASPKARPADSPAIARSSPGATTRTG